MVQNKNDGEQKKQKHKKVLKQQDGFFHTFSSENIYIYLYLTKTRMAKKMLCILSQQRIIVVTADENRFVH